MSSGMSSDQIVKNEIKDKVKRFEGIALRIFPDSSNEDQKLVEEGLLEVELDNIFLTSKGLDLANLVWKEFI